MKQRAAADAAPEVTRDAATARESKVVLEIAGELVRGLATGGGRAIVRASHTDFDAPRQRIGSRPKAVDPGSSAGLQRNRNRRWSSFIPLAGTAPRRAADSVRRGCIRRHRDRAKGAWASDYTCLRALDRRAAREQGADERDFLSVLDFRATSQPALISPPRPRLEVQRAAHRSGAASASRTRATGKRPAQPAGGTPSNELQRGEFKRRRARPAGPIVDSLGSSQCLLTATRKPCNPRKESIVMALA